MSFFPPFFGCCYYDSAPFLLFFPWDDHSTLDIWISVMKYLGYLGDRKGEDSKSSERNLTLADSVSSVRKRMTFTDQILDYDVHSSKD